MAKAMQYSAYPQHPAAGRRPEPTVAARAATRRVVKIGPLVLIVCLILAILAVLMVPMVVGGAASVSGATATSTAQPVDRVAYDSVQDAVKALDLPKEVVACLPENAVVETAAVVNGAYLELALTYGKDSYLYRAAAGSDDLSGVNYETYGYTAAEELNDTTVGYVGVSEKKLNAAVWINGDCTYALVSENGVAAADMRALTEAMA